MSKKLFLILLLIFTCIFVSSCKKNEKSVILFNHYPITQKNILQNSTIFKTDQRIYYIYLTRRNLTTEDIRVKIFKRSEKANYGYGDMVYSNTFRLRPGEINYFTDYIVFHKAGTYIMHVYRMDYLWKPDAIADFRVDER